MNVYRINLRFDLDDERERMAAEYLQQFPQRGKTTRNRFASYISFTTWAKYHTRCTNDFSDIQH